MEEKMMSVHPIVTIPRHHDVSFHANGRIDLSAHVTGVLDLHPGDVINIAESDSLPIEYYLYVWRRAADLIGRHSGTCRPAKGKGRYLRAFCKRLTDHMLRLCPGYTRLNFRVGSPTFIDHLGITLPLITLPLHHLSSISNQSHLSNTHHSHKTS